MEWLRIYREADIENPIMIAGWPGMGNVAMGAVGYLRDKLGAKDFAEIKPKGFFEPTGVSIEGSVAQMLQLPQNRFFYWKNRSSGNDIIIFLGEAQPSARVYLYASVILDLAERYRVKRLYTAAAAPASIHHRETPRVWAVANNKKLVSYLKSFDVALMESGPISGMNGLLLGVAAERSIEGICLLGEIPYYTVGIPYPKSSQVVLEAMTQMLGIQIDMTELELLGQQTEQEVERLVQTSEQMSKLFDRLAEQKGGVADIDGEPRDTSSEIRLRQHIEVLFREAEGDKSKAIQLKDELDRLGLFEEYEDRFLDLFKRGDQ